MCGICGWLDFGGKIDYSVIERMNNIARHRGPDDEGYTAIGDKIVSLKGNDTCDLNENLGNIQEYEEQAFLAMGHRRLSIIDLSPAGHQPMVSSDGTKCLTFNGEIYNYIELKEELTSLGYQFYTNSDTEVLLQAYAHWGEDCVTHFIGMWAFVIWDSVENKLFCSRDRLGAKPFYYYKDPKRFVFSSEIKQICANPMVPRKINEDIMVAQIMWGITDFSKETLIKDIYALPGGYNLRIVLNKRREEFKEFSIYNYWDIDVEQDRVKAYGSDLFEELKSAVSIRTRSDVPIGVLLSGGLDSSCLVAEISQLYREQGKESSLLDTYTSCYEDFEEGDERNYAQAVNEYCGVKQNFIYPNPQDTFTSFEKMVWHMEGGFSFSTLGSFMTLNEISKRGAKVLINGQGSDETMFGYERYYAYYFKDLLAKGKFRKFVSEYKQASRNSRLNMKLLMQYFLYFNIPFIRKARCYARMKSYVSSSVKRNFLQNKEIHEYLFFGSLKKLQYNELRGTQLTHILRMDDRAYMAFSMESRVPYIDYRFMEAAVKISEEEKIQNGYTKYLLRKYIEGRLPDHVVWRNDKMGWPSPSKRWVERFDQDRVRELFDNARTGKYFNVGELKKLYLKDPASWPIEQFMIVELFVRQFDVQM